MEASAGELNSAEPAATADSNQSMMEKTVSKNQMV